MIAPDLAQGRLVPLSDLSVLEDFGDDLTQHSLTPRDSGLRKARQAFLAWIDQEKAAG